jgi:hypothetical protein
MARKTLLTEAEIRQFMKLANIEPLQEMGGELPVPGARDEDEEEEEPGMRDYMQEAEDEEEPGMRDEMMEEEEEEAPAPEMPAPEGGEEMEMDMEMPAPADDMDMGGMDAGGAKEEQFADIVDKLADLLGLDADVEVGGEEEMGGEVEADEGGDLDMADAAPEAPEMEMGDEDEADEPMMESDDDIVQEVARRVAARLLREKKEEDIANKLAERIFRRLASK